jgi:hypothetical protein
MRCTRVKREKRKGVVDVDIAAVFSTANIKRERERERESSSVLLYTVKSHTSTNTQGSSSQQCARRLYKYKLTLSSCLRHINTVEKRVVDSFVFRLVHSL